MFMEVYPFVYMNLALRGIYLIFLHKDYVHFLKIMLCKVRFLEIVIILDNNYIILITSLSKNKS